MFRRRRELLHPVNALCCFLVLSCTLSCVARNGPCYVNGTQNSSEFDDFGLLVNDYDSGLSYGTICLTVVCCGTPRVQCRLENNCANTQSFCSPSTISGFSYEEKWLREAPARDFGTQSFHPLLIEPTQHSMGPTNSSPSSDYGMFTFFNGRDVSCYLNNREGINDLSSLHIGGANEHDVSSCGDYLLKQRATHFWLKDSKMTETGSFDNSSSPNINICLNLQDQGQKHLYFPSTGTKISVGYKGNFFSALCLQFLRSLAAKSNIIIVPFKVEMDGNAANTGDMSLVFRRAGVSRMEPEMDGLLVHYCRGFSLGSGESMKLLTSYQIDFSTDVVHQDLELASASGILVIPMRANFPLFMPRNYKRPIFLLFMMRAARSIILVVASLMFLVICCIFPQTLARASLDYSCKNEKSSICVDAETKGKTPSPNFNQRKSKLSASTKMDCILLIKDKTLTLQACSERCSEVQISEKGMCKQIMPSRRNHVEDDLLGGHEDIALPSSKVEGSNLPEASQCGNVTVRTGKDKGKRRRKRKAPGAKLTRVLEVSSGQSSYPIPSSPSSPVTSAMPQRNWLLSSDVENSTVVQNPLAEVASQPSERIQASVGTSKTDKVEPEVAVNYHHDNLFIPSRSQMSDLNKLATGKPDMISSAAFPFADNPIPRSYSPPILVLPSRVAPHARAPGSKLHSQERMEVRERAVIKDEYTYDIWGEHFSGLHLISMSKNITYVVSSSRENSSEL